MEWLAFLGIPLGVLLIPLVPIFVYIPMVIIIRMIYCFKKYTAASLSFSFVVGYIVLALLIME